VAMALLQEVKLLKVTIEVCSDVIARVALVMNVLICSLVGEIHLTRVWSHIGECVEDVGQVLGGNERRRIFPSIYSPVCEVANVVFS